MILIVVCSIRLAPSNITGHGGFPFKGGEPFEVLSLFPDNNCEVHLL